MNIRANENQTINISGLAQARAQEKAGRRSQGQNRKSIFAGNLNMQQDAVTQRRQYARQKALKIISNAWEGDRKMDQTVLDIKDKINLLRDEIAENRKIVEADDVQKKNLQEQYGISDEDLELLQKKGRLAPLTEEEESRLAELEGPALDEFKQAYGTLNEHQNIYKKEIARAEGQIQACNNSIRAMRMERDKSAGNPPMLKAQKQADGIMEQAGKEVVGMLIDEAKDHVDETYEEERKEAKEKAEEKAEQEEKIEERREEKEKIEAQIDAAREESHEAEETRREQEERAREDTELLENMAEAGMTVSGSSSDVQVEIKEMLRKMKLLGEDIKGASVDEEL